MSKEIKCDFYFKGEIMEGLNGKVYGEKDFIFLNDIISILVSRLHEQYYNDPRFSEIEREQVRAERSLLKRCLDMVSFRYPLCPAGIIATIRANKVLGYFDDDLYKVLRQLILNYVNA